MVDGRPQANADLQLKTTHNLAGQLTNAEWLMSMPGTEDQKRGSSIATAATPLSASCAPPTMPDEFTQVLHRMANYTRVSPPLKPQKRIGIRANGGREPERKDCRILPGDQLEQARHLGLPAQDAAAPHGRATQVVITEYDLPRRLIEPHDVVLDRDGTVWYSDFGEQFLGELDPKTGKVTRKSDARVKKGFPVGTLDLETDKTGNIWIGMMYQGAIAKFDPKTEKFAVWPSRRTRGYHAPSSTSGRRSTSVDGNVWTNNRRRP